MSDRTALPNVRRIAVLANPDNPGNRRALDAVEAAAWSLHAATHGFAMRDPGDLERTFGSIAAKRVDALAVVEDPRIIANFRGIAELAVKQRLPSIGFVDYADAGGLLGYGVDYLARVID